MRKSTARAIRAETTGNNNSPSDMLPPEDEDSNGPGDDQDGSGGRYEGNGQIIDGGQYYGDLTRLLWKRLSRI